MTAFAVIALETTGFAYHHIDGVGDLSVLG